MDWLSRISPRVLAALVAGFLMGLIWFVAIRMALMKDTSVHYHANFAVFIEGQRLPLEGPTFYEEVTACGLEGPDDPKRRVHLHGNVPHIVHVHDEAVTWSHLFSNLRFGLSDASLSLDDRVLVAGAEGKDLSFWLNGEKVERVANQLIKNEDTLLVTYGGADEAAQRQQYDQIPKEASQYNSTADPAACSGAPPLNFVERLKRALSP